MIVFTTRRVTMFYRKPGKVCGTTKEVWIGILSRRGVVNPASEVDAMIQDGRLITSFDQEAV